MQLVRGIPSLELDDRGAAVAVGNFDGVHLGHQALLRAARERAVASGARCEVLTFDPHPREFLDPDGAPPRLMRVTEKCLALESLGVDRLVVMRFDERLRQLEPDEFIDRVLVAGLHARHVIVGDGFRFGRARRGTVAALCEAGAAKGFEVVTVPPVEYGGERVSSTRIRAALAAGDLATAEHLLGRRFVLCGRVIAGAKLGRQLGFATANMRLHRARLPLGGIFAVVVHGAGDGRVHDGVASLGTRPTVNGIEPLLEAHLFDYAGDLYGRRLSVEFVGKLRDEERFPSLEALTEQMHRDAARAREILAARAA
jgi:riboflavin kinase / FMN adenylyltransferase